MMLGSEGDADSDVANQKLIMHIFPNLKCQRLIPDFSKCRLFMIKRDVKDEVYKTSVWS